jgi:hypothetical protein
MSLATHVVQNDAMNRELRIERPASCDKSRCVYSYLGGSYIQLPPKPGTEL